jgi:hypothetical protein
MPLGPTTLKAKDPQIRGRCLGSNPSPIHKDPKDLWNYSKCILVASFKAEFDYCGNAGAFHLHEGLCRPTEVYLLFFSLIETIHIVIPWMISSIESHPSHPF